MPEEDKNIDELDLKSVSEMMFGEYIDVPVVIESMTSVVIDGATEDEDVQTVDEDEFYDANDAIDQFQSKKIMSN